MGRKKALKRIRTALDTHLILHMEDLGLRIVDDLTDMFTRGNPDFFKKQRMGFYTGGIPKQIKSFRIEKPFIILPRGSLEKVQDFLEERKMEMKPVWDRTLSQKSLNLKLKKELWPYQNEASMELAGIGNGTIRGPCGSGKTIILLGAIAKLDQPTLIVVHSAALMSQWKARIAEWLGVIPGNIGGGKKLNIRPITVGMQQTIWKRTNPHWIRNFGVIAGDEIHHWAARTFQVTASMFPAAYRIGASADERRKDGLEFLIYETFGPCVHTITEDELQKKGRLLPIRMEVIPTDYIDDNYLESIEAEETPDWVNMVTRLSADEDRNALILHHVKRVLQKRQTRILMLNDRVGICKMWYEHLNRHGISAGLMIGGQKNRRHLEETKDGLIDGSVRVGIGTTVADEGLDMPPLSHVFITCPVHTNAKRLVQMVGRAARTFTEKADYSYRTYKKREGVAVYFWDKEMFGFKDEDQFLKKLRKVCSELEVMED